MVNQVKPKSFNENKNSKSPINHARPYFLIEETHKKACLENWSMSKQFVIYEVLCVAQSICCSEIALKFYFIFSFDLSAARFCEKMKNSLRLESSRE
jgi:hypothetical protein